jgi:hypothetical protein
VERWLRVLALRACVRRGRGRGTQGRTARRGQLALHARMRAMRATEARDGAWPAEPAASCGCAPGRGVRRPWCAESPTSGHMFTMEVPGHLYAEGRSIQRVAKPECRRARALGAATSSSSSVLVPISCDLIQTCITPKSDS